MRLSDMSGFHHESSMPVNTDDTKFVLTDPYHFMLVGGNTHGWAGRSTRNWLRWNDENKKMLFFYFYFYLFLGGTMRRRGWSCLTST